MKCVKSDLIAQMMLGKPCRGQFNLLKGMNAGVKQLMWQ